MNLRRKKVFVRTYVCCQSVETADSISAQMTINSHGYYGYDASVNLYSAVLHYGHNFYSNCSYNIS